jgi:DNA-binding NtrC family response regulator
LPMISTKGSPNGTSNGTPIGAAASRTIGASGDAAAPNWFGFLEQALRRDPGVYVILVSEDYSVEGAIEAIKHGAYDYLAHPLERARLSQTLTDLDKQFQRRRHIHELERQLVSDLEFHGIVGHSPAMIELFELARKIARHNTHILLTGASGTGKELVAHAIHMMSPNAERRFAVCNCCAMTDTLLESQLFGSGRGASPSGLESRAKLSEFADGDTIFLDEVGDASPTLQAKLVHAIDTSAAPNSRQLDLRVIASTNRDLRDDVAAGRFREDLFLQLSKIQLNVPSLVERLDDLPLLVEFFLKKYNKAYHKHIQGLTRRVQTVLLQQAWPGNVRELENVISGAVLVATNDFIDLADLPEHLRKPAGSEASNGARKPMSLDEVRQEHIQHVLELCRGNRVRTAQLLGIGRTSLYRYLKRDGVAGKSANSLA